MFFPRENTCSQNMCDMIMSQFPQGRFVVLIMNSVEIKLGYLLTIVR